MTTKPNRGVDQQFMSRVLYSIFAPYPRWLAAGRVVPDNDNTRSLT